MNSKVNFPKNLTALSVELLENVKGFDSSELYWLSGYCHGIAEGQASNQEIPQV